METTPEKPLAAFCSHGIDYQAFLTSQERVDAELRLLLTHYGVSEELRAKAHQLFTMPDYASGIRLEEGKDEERVVIYVKFPIRFVDGKKKQLKELLPEIFIEQVPQQEEQVTSAWPEQDAA